MLFYTSVAVLAPAIALSEATGLNKYIAVVLIYSVCIFYSSQGGMKAVVIADTFQLSYVSSAKQSPVRVPKDGQDFSAVYYIASHGAVHPCSGTICSSDSCVPRVRTVSRKQCQRGE
uniref:Uncharacterized protein n=1 Tax=Anopheles culicifacies TaxID=139723 RepID=A0A182MWV9_9DIPT